MFDQSYDILPDDETWANPYSVIKFPERPSAATVAVSIPIFPDQVQSDLLQNPSAVPSSPRLRKAFLRPGEDADGAKLLDFYLPEEEDVARVDEILRTPMTTERLQELNESGQVGEDEHFTPVRIELSLA